MLEPGTNFTTLRNKGEKGVHQSFKDILCTPDLLWIEILEKCNNLSPRNFHRILLAKVYTGNSIISHPLAKTCQLKWAFPDAQYIEVRKAVDRRVQKS